MPKAGVATHDDHAQPFSATWSHHRCKTGHVRRRDAYCGSHDGKKQGDVCLSPVRRTEVRGKANPNVSAERASRSYGHLSTNYSRIEGGIAKGQARKQSLESSGSNRGRVPIFLPYFEQCPLSASIVNRFPLPYHRLCMAGSHRSRVECCHRPCLRGLLSPLPSPSPTQATR